MTESAAYTENRIQIAFYHMHLIIIVVYQFIGPSIVLRPQERSEYIRMPLPPVFCTARPSGSI